MEGESQSVKHKFT